jgi:glucokinase
VVWRIDMKEYFAGVDLGGTKILTVVADNEKKIISKVKLATESEKGVNGVMENIFNSIYLACEEAGIGADLLSGIGAGVPGPVNVTNGIVYDCPNLPGWKNIEIGRMLSEKFKVPVRIQNDARVAGLAEVRKGSAFGCRHVFYVTVSTGIGGAVIVDGNIFPGADGAAGECGQMRLPDGTIFEHRYAGPAIKKIFGISTHELPELVQKRDPGAIKALDHLIDGLSIFLANITTLLNPEIIVVGGGVSSLGDILLKPLERKVKQHAFSISAMNVKIVKAGLGTDSGAIGAVELLFDK